MRRRAAGGSAARARHRAARSRSERDPERSRTRKGRRKGHGYTQRMATADVAAPRGLGINEESVALAGQLRHLARIATFVALLTSPALIFWLHRHEDWPLWSSILGGLGGVIAFRG